MSDSNLEFEQYCFHWNDLGTCDKKCKNCGHECRHHNENNKKIFSGGICYCGLFCDCKEFVG